MPAPGSGQTSAWRAAFAGAMALVISGCQSVAFGVLNSGSSSLPSINTVTYDNNFTLNLDIHRPKSPTAKPPIAVFFYGGSWRSGNRGQYAFVGEALAKSGIIAVIPDYRIFPQGRFPDFEYDAANAVRWVFDHASELGGDPEQIFLVGHSAGAQIAALLATDQRYLATVGLVPANLAGVVGISGPYDFLPLTDPDLIEVFGKEQDWPESQPVNFVDGDEPPFLLLHGADDHVVWPRNSTSLQSKLNAVGVTAELISYPSMGHFKIVAAFRYESLAPTLRDTAAFVTTSGRSVSRQAPRRAVDATSQNQ